LNTVPKRYRQTDRQTDRRLTVASPRSALASRGKNWLVRLALAFIPPTAGHSINWQVPCGTATFDPSVTEGVISYFCSVA